MGKRLCSGKHSRRCCGCAYALEKVSAFGGHGHRTLHVFDCPRMVEAARCRFMARRLGSPRARRTGCWRKNRTALAMQGIGSDGATKCGLLPPMRNPSTCRVLRRAWTAGRLAGSLRFSPWPRILPTGSSLSTRNPAPPGEPPSIPFDQASVGREAQRLSGSAPPWVQRKRISTLSRCC